MYVDVTVTFKCEVKWKWMTIDDVLLLACLWCLIINRYWQLLRNVNSIRNWKTERMMVKKKIMKKHRGVFNGACPLLAGEENILIFSVKKLRWDLNTFENVHLKCTLAPPPFRVLDLSPKESIWKKWKWKRSIEEADEKWLQLIAEIVKTEKWPVLHIKKWV